MSRDDADAASMGFRSSGEVRDWQRAQGQKCGFDHVRPVKDKPGRYACSVCGRIMPDSWKREANVKEVNKREPINEPTLKA